MGMLAKILKWLGRSLWGFVLEILTEFKKSIIALIVAIIFFLGAAWLVIENADKWMP